MHHRSFSEFFKAATGGRLPYPYQERFATADVMPHLLRAPTGAGKTATAVLGWLYRYLAQAPNTPRRLVYCLPMRVLVEQSTREANAWIKNLGLDVPVHVLMGGVDTDEWYLHPEKPAVLIGTQDMLLSRTLNRGYAETRFHWPIDFGLLNNDCLWVFDEPQLMANGVSTSAQMHGLRKSLGTFGACPSVWMSATLEPGWLDTVDFAGKFPGQPLELSDKDYEPTMPLNKRMTAKKTLNKLEAASSKDMKDVAKAVLELHKAGDGFQTLVILNTVERAKATFAELKKQTRDKANLLLVHSRYRPAEREKLNAALQDKGEVAKGRIIVSTQVVEAGVDISARTLITELAPWASIVQRIGRCNRTGDDGPGAVYWIDLDTKLALPYTEDDLGFARMYLVKLEGESVSPKDLDTFKTAEKIVLPFEHKHVLRRRDLLDLFDTSPDLSGNDIDISRFVRSDDPDTDVQVFWRAVGPDQPNADTEGPHRRELCNVPVGDAKTFFEKSVKRTGYLWDHIDEEWREIRDAKREIRPGLTILLPTTAGGYSDLGWDASSTAAVEPVAEAPVGKAEGTGSDPLSGGPKLTLVEHTQHVCDELAAVLKDITHLPGEWPAHLRTASRWHDVGKAHFAFQAGVRAANPALPKDGIWAKSGTNGRLRHSRKYFRHELASALAALKHGKAFEIAYLIATHHGKVRLSIRTLPKESPLPDRPATLFALGVWDGDDLPDVELGNNEKCPATKLDLSPMKLGGPASWTGRALDLMQKIGPFKLAYLEALLRAADLRASAKERKETPNA
jgi:CRISPR-associated endonuclease/helicase Cas3